MGKARGSADRVLDVVCVGLVRASDELEKWVRLANIKLNILHKSPTLKTECDMLQLLQSMPIERDTETRGMPKKLHSS